MLYFGALIQLEAAGHTGHTSRRHHLRPPRSTRLGPRAVHQLMFETQTCEMAVSRCASSLSLSCAAPQRTRLMARALGWPATMPTTPCKLMPA